MMKVRQIMQLRQLEAFSAVISVGSVTGAAKLLNRSQPAISRLIQDLEAEAGFALFERNGPRVTPTERAYQLYQEVERSLHGLTRIRQRATEIAAEKPAPIHLMATTALSATIVPLALSLLQETGLPDRIVVQSASAEHVVQAVLSRGTDIGLATLPIEHRGIDLHWIGGAPCVAVLAESDPLAQQERIALADLAGQRLITGINPYRLRGRIDYALAAAGIAPQQLMETNTSLNAIMAARAGLGVALVEPATAYGLPLQGVVVRAIDTDIPFYFGLVTPGDKPLSPDLIRLVTALQQASQMLLQNFELLPAARHDELMQRIYQRTAAARPEAE